MARLKDSLIAWIIVLGLIASFSVTDYKFDFEDGNFSVSKKEPLTWDRENISIQIHREINEERVSQGLEKLDYSEELEEISLYHSQQMSEINFFAHTSPSGQEMIDRYDRFKQNCYTAAENIYKTYWKESVTGEGFIETRGKLADSVVEGWMASPGHRKNILLEDMDSEGIGVYKNSEGQVYVTQNFCS